MAKVAKAKAAFVIKPIVKTDSLTFINKRKRGSQYDAIVEAIKKLTKVGDSFEVENKDKVATFNNRLNGVLSAAGPAPTKGTAIVKRATGEYTYAFSCVAEADAPKKTGRKSKNK